MRIDTDRCHLCGGNIGLLSSRWMVRKVVRPPGHRFRYRLLGYACEPCADRYPEKLTQE